jgi:hypothetical protein
MHPYDIYIRIYGRLPTERDPRYLELVRMTKYRVTDVPDTQPGKCTNCGASRQDGRKYIDIGVDVEFYGVVIFCSLCIADFNRTLGLDRALLVKIHQLEQKVAELQGRHDLGEELKNTVLHTFEQVKEYFDGASVNAGTLSKSDDSVSGRAASVESLDKSSGETERSVGQADRETTSTKSGPVKSTSVSGSKNIPKLTELLEARNK